MGVIAVENLIAAIEKRPDDILSNVEVIGLKQYFPNFFVAPFPITIDSIDQYPAWTDPVDYKKINPNPPWWK